MSLRSLAWFPPARTRCLAAAAAVLLLPIGLAAPGRAADFIDSGGRRVVLPDRINRVMAAEPSAAVLVFALAPKKLAGWPRPPERGYLPANYGRLPVTGQLTGANPAATVEAARRARPDIIIDCGVVDPARITFADRMQQETGIPYLLVDDSVARIPAVLRSIGALLGEQARGDDLALYAEYAINSLRGRLLVQSATKRPHVYYGRGPNGMNPALPRSQAGEIISEAGAINVARPPAPGEPPAMTPALLRQWDPEIIIAEDRGFYNALHRDPAWRGLRAVRNKKVFLEPSGPFGWIDDPTGINRLIGLYWLSALFYPDDNQEDMRSQVHDFYEKFYGAKLGDKQIEAMVRAAGIPPSETPQIGPLPAATLPSGPGVTSYPPGRLPYGTSPGGGLGTPSGIGTPAPGGLGAPTSLPKP